MGGLAGRLLALRCRCYRQWPRDALIAAGLAFSLATMPIACAQTATQGTASAPPPTVQPAPVAQMPSFAPVVRKVIGAVVNVSATQKPGGATGDEGAPDQDQGELQGPPQSPFEELLRRFFEQQPIPRSNLQSVALGSGFIIDPGGDIVTDNHVVENAGVITVVFQDNTRLPAKIVGRDPLTDLALLKIDADHPLPYVTWGDSDAAQVGDWVLAVGNPFGLGGTVSSGIISARGRDIHAGPYDDFLQIDASINRGNSGGPTFNLAGQVIGINTAIYTPSGGSVGIAFAIPSSLAKPIIEQLKSHGKVQRGWLGVQIQEVTPELAKGLGLPKATGALVAGMTEGGPAAKAGFRQGDVILSFNGHEIQRMRDLPLIVAETPVGQKAEVKLWRAGSALTLSPIVGEMPENLSPAALHPRGAPKPQAERTSSVMGLTLAPLTAESRRQFHVPSTVKGVVVTTIANDSPFAALDVERGDVIELINQQPVATPQDAVSMLKAAAGRKDQGILLLINRRGSGRFIALSGDRGAR